MLKTLADGKETIDGLPYLDAFFTGRSVVDISRPLLNKFVEQRQKDGASPAYINRNLALLRRMLHLLADEHATFVVPRFPRLKEPDARQGFCTREQFAKLYTELPERLRTLALFLYTVGCRKGEATKLDWSQVDWDSRLIRVAASQTKNAKARTIPLAEVVFVRLQKVPKHARRGPLFPVGNFRKAWQSACCKAGLGTLTKDETNGGYGLYKGLLVHDLRRSAVRNLREEGIGEVVAMSVSGHKTNEVFKRYSIVVDEDKTAAVAKVGSSLAGVLVGSSSGQVSRRSRRRNV
jgi:integrase